MFDDGNESNEIPINPLEALQRNRNLNLIDHIRNMFE